jgi:hypothetical protein
MSLRRLALAAVVALLSTPVGGLTGAAEPPAGTTNFRAPTSTPDYFSNESGPFHSSASPAPGPYAAPAIAAPAPRAAITEPRRYVHYHERRATARRGWSRAARRDAAGRRHDGRFAGHYVERRAIVRGHAGRAAAYVHRASWSRGAVSAGRHAASARHGRIARAGR